MRGTLGVAIGAVLLSAFGSVPLTAHAATVTCSSPCIDLDKDAFTVTGERERGAVPESAESKDRSASAVNPLRREKLFVPTCSGNTPGGIDVLCGIALSGCPDPADVRFWVYTRLVNTQIPGDDPAFERVAAPPFVCLRADDPAIANPLAALPWLVEREFQRVVVLKAVPVVNPAPKTLIRIPTRLSTSTVESYDIPVSILGQSVVITATARTWTWNFGDGQRAAVSGSGRAGRTEHEYQSTGPRSARVDITWTGVYRLNGGPPLPITGTVTTQGVPTRIQVVQARSELVAQ